MQKGEVVTVRGFGGEELTRRVIAEDEEHVVVCREEEFRLAERQGREPVGVGFLKEFVIR